MDDIGSKASKSPLQVHAVTAPSPDVMHDGAKDFERLKQLRALHIRVENTWLDGMQQRMLVLVATPARKLGFGPWKKKYEDEDKLRAALDAHIRPVFEKLWGVSLAAIDELPGEPPPHPGYLADLAHYGLAVTQDDIKHVAHAYVMQLAHTYFRHALAEQRNGGRILIPQEVQYVIEVNLCQYYVPQGLSAYFEAQPLRAIAREVANRFRKVAFGGM